MNPTARPRRRQATWRQRLLLAGAAVLGAVVATELLLRVTGVAPPDPYGWVGQRANAESAILIVDPEIGWRVRPGLSYEAEWYGSRARYDADRDGFRCDPERLEARPAERTIAIVGDSNSWGYGVPLSQSYGGILERELPGVAVRNFAMPAFGVDQMWLTLRRYALPAHPDLVIVGLLHDDFQRSLHVYRRFERMNKPTFTLQGGTLRRLTARDRPGAVLEWLETECHVWAAAKHLAQELGRRYRIGTWWHLNAAILDAIRRDCAAHDTPVLFVRLPDPSGRDFPSLAAYMRDCGAPYVDPAGTPPPEPGPQFFPDWHLNAAGHRWIAAAVLPWLRAHFVR